MEPNSSWQSNVAKTDDSNGQFTVFDFLGKVGDEVHV
jgi:hypothetical protein